MKIESSLSLVIFITVFLLLLLATFYYLIPVTQLKVILINSYSYTCHQNPERSFKFQNHQMLICARCTGIYFGILIFLLMSFTINKFKILSSRVNMRFLIIFMLPLLMDWTINFLFNIDSGNFVRFLTGFFFGFIPVILLLNIEIKD